MKNSVLVDKFDAKGKSSGNSYHVLVYQDAVPSASGEVEEPLGSRIYQLSDGRALHPLSETKFKIADTDEKILRI